MSWTARTLRFGRQRSDRRDQRRRCRPLGTAWLAFRDRSCDSRSPKAVKSAGVVRLLGFVVLGRFLGFSLLFLPALGLVALACVDAVLVLAHLRARQFLHVAVNLLQHLGVLLAGHARLRVQRQDRQLRSTSRQSHVNRRRITAQIVG